MAAMGFAPRVTYTTVSSTGLITIENGESVIIHGVSISSTGFVLYRIEDADGNILGGTTAALNVIVNGTDNRAPYIPTLYDSGFIINFTTVLADAHVTVFHESGGG